MKPKTLVKKLSATLLATTMTASSFSQFSMSVFAQDTTRALSKEQFATVEQLKSFNTNDTDGEKNPAKIYFGDDNQRWWIAGSQNGNLTLFAASPLAANRMDVYKMFDPNPYQSKSYDNSWNCTYEFGFTAPDTVNANFYGGSPLRKTLEGFVNSKFTNAEQGLMKNTTIHTKDMNNNVYFTTDILYLAFGSYGNPYITVGEVENKMDLDSGLRIDRDYLTNERFWLRAAGSSDYLALVTSPSYDMARRGVQNRTTSDFATVVPAFALDPSSVLFASAAPAASSDGNLTIQDTDGDGAFTLRYSGKNLGSAIVSYDKSKVTLTNVPNGTYLVVQNSSGAKAKQITRETEVFATDMGLDSFANCEVWLETTDATDRMTYATLATEEQGHDVNITASEGLIVSNGVQGVGQGCAIIDIVVEVSDGYYLPDGYTDTIQGMNGLNVKNATQTGFTITGTPTADVNITLPAATEKQEQTFPTDITLSGTGGSGVGIYGTTTAMEYAPVISTMAKDISSPTWNDCLDGYTPVAPGTYLVRLKETETKKASDTVTVVVTKLDTGSGGGGSTVKLDPVYRAYNPNNGEHLYTVDEKEFKHVTSIGWDAEGVGFMAEEEKNGQALYRVYNPNSGLHHYTIDETEKNTLVSLGWYDEKIAWYTNKKPQSAPVFRVYNPNDGNHHYTMNKQEKDTLVSYGWQDEGIAFRTAPIEK